MARATVVCARRLVSRSRCPCFPFARFVFEVCSAVRLRSAACAFSLARCATARASVTCFDGCLDCSDTIGHSPSLILSRRQAGVVGTEADGRAPDEADSRTGMEADGRCARLRTQQNRLLWSPSLPACLQTAYEALPERRFNEESGRRGSNPRQPAWKASTYKVTARLLRAGSMGGFIDETSHMSEPDKGVHKHCGT